MKKIAKIILINIVLILLVERIIGLLIPEIPTYYNGEGHYSSNHKGYFTEGKLKDGTTVYFIPTSKEVTLRYKQKEKSPKNFKLLAFGDSFTEGQGVAASDTWVKKIEEFYPKGSFLASNYAVSGSDSKEIAEKIETVLSNEDADLAVYALVLNDPYYLPNKKGTLLDSDDRNDYNNDSGLFFDFILWRTKVFENNRSPFLNFFARHSKVANYLITQIELKKISENTIQYYKDLFNKEINKDGLKQTFIEIEKMKLAAKKKNVPFLIMIFPLFYQTQNNYPFKKIHKFLAKELEKRQIKVLDLFPFYQGIKDQDLWVHLTDQHPNKYAHEVAAEALNEWIKKNIDLTKKNIFQE